MVEAEPDARLDRFVVGLTAGDLHATRQVDSTLGHFDHRHRRPMVEVVVVRDAVLDVRAERGQNVFDDCLCADRTDDRQRRLLERHHPAGRDDVVEVGDVIAVQVRDQHSSEVRRTKPCRSQPHQDAAACIDEVMLASSTLAGRDQRGWSRPIW